MFRKSLDQDHRHFFTVDLVSRVLMEPEVLIRIFSAKNVAPALPPKAKPQAFGDLSVWAVL